MFGKTTGAAVLAAAVALGWAASPETPKTPAPAPALTSPEYWLRAAEGELDRAPAAPGDTQVGSVRVELARAWLEAGRLDPAMALYDKVPLSLRPWVADGLAAHLLAEKKYEQAARFFHVAGPMDRFSYVATIARHLRDKDPELAVEFADRLPEAEQQDFLTRLAVIATQIGSLDLARALRPRIKDAYNARMTGAAIEVATVPFAGRDYTEALQASGATAEEFLDHLLVLDWQEAKHLDAALVGKAIDRLSDPAGRLRQRVRLARALAAGGKQADAKAALAAAERDLAEVPAERRQAADLLRLAETKVRAGDVAGGLAVLGGLIEGRSKETADAYRSLLVECLLDAGAYAEAQRMTDPIPPAGRTRVVGKWARHYIAKGQTGKVGELLKAQPAGPRRAMVCLGVAQGLLDRQKPQPRP